MHAFSGDRLAGESLMAEVQAIKADLLMMGAYSTGFVRDVMFGGATNFILRNADLPVLMAYL